MLQIRQVQSDLALEKLIYFNSFYSLVYGATLVFQTAFKCAYLRNDEKVALIMPIFTALWCLTEFFRLRLGSFGNKRESVRFGARAGRRPQVSPLFSLSLARARSAPLRQPHFPPPPSTLPPPARGRCPSCLPSWCSSTCRSCP